MTTTASPQTGGTPVTIHHEGEVAWVTIVNPTALNSLTLAVKEGLLQALADVASDDSIRCVVLTGAGDRAFCVGQDLVEHARALEGPEPWSTVMDHYAPIVELLAGMDKPVIARLNGATAGAGAAFALACDLRVMVADARLTFAFAGIGLSCDSGTSWSLAHTVGLARAKELLMLNESLTAQEALADGLVTRVASRAELDDVVREMAHRLAQGPTTAYGSMKGVLRQAAGASLSQALAAEATQMERTGKTRDHRRAVEAFLAKERPRFIGS